MLLCFISVIEDSADDFRFSTLEVLPVVLMPGSFTFRSFMISLHSLGTLKKGQCLEIGNKNQAH
jgi:hypothetical protein